MERNPALFDIRKGPLSRREGLREVKPLAIDLYCGLGGWTEGLLVEGYRVVGFDIERHEYGDHTYPAQLVIQDVLTLHGSQFKDAALMIAKIPLVLAQHIARAWKPSLTATS